MLFLQTYLQTVWPNEWSIDQFWHPIATAVEYPAHKTVDGDPATHFLTSRVRVGESVSFTTPESQLLTCQNVQLVWDFRDGTVVQGRTAQHVFRRPGTYSVRFSMRGYGSNACVASHCVSREIVVEP